MKQILMFSSGERLANLSQSQDCEKEWLTLVATWHSTFSALLTLNAPRGWYGRTSPESCHLTKEGILETSSEGWQNSGMGSPTEFWTLNTSEFPKDAVVSSLSDILETGDLPRRFFLSPTACRGILCRAEKRGKELPRQLREALLLATRGTQE